MKFMRLSREGVSMMLIARFRLQYCWSSSGEEVYCLRVAICSALVCCYWCISILSKGPHWSAVALFDRGYPGFGNIDSTIPIDFVGMKSYMDSPFDPTCVPVGVTINKFNLARKRNMPRFFSVIRNRRGLSTSKPYVFWSSWSCSFILSRVNLPVSPIYTLSHSRGIL